MESVSWMEVEAKRCKAKTEGWPEWRKKIARETPEEYLARGNKITVLDPTERSIKDPNREFSICSAGARERKRAELQQWAQDMGLYHIVFVHEK